MVLLYMNFPKNYNKNVTQKRDLWLKYKHYREVFYEKNK